MRALKLKEAVRADPVEKVRSNDTRMVKKPAEKRKAKPMMEKRMLTITMLMMTNQ